MFWTKQEEPLYKNLNPSLLGASGLDSEIIELALTFGFRGLDLDIAAFTQRAETQGTPYALRLIRSAKLRLTSFQLPVDLNAADDVFKQGLEDLTLSAKMAAEAECTRCVTRIDPASDQRPYHENFESHRVRFAEVCQVLEPHGVRLGVGFRASEELRKDRSFQFIHEMSALGQLVQMVGAANIGVLFDTWDAHRSGMSPEQLRGLSAEKIVAVRVADLPADAPTEGLTEASRHLPEAEGRVDVPAYLRVLAELGYEGPVTPAPERKTLQGLRRDEVVRRAGQAMNALWQEAGLR